jgi:RNA polymerase sigma factor (sigma-70 family)
MAHAPSTSLGRQLGALFEGGSTAGLSDRQLLERFASGRDEAGEAAFAALVARHGPMVLGVCRQLVGDHHHAEDAFQAVFLILAHKAGSLREPELLGNWLYGVALYTARRARVRSARRRQIEEQGAANRPEAQPAEQAEQMIERERSELLYREIGRLPGSFRSAILLCYFEGLSPDEAAARLRLPSGTLRSRLVRARDRLRRGLARRGVVLSTAAIAAALASGSATASVSTHLCDRMARAAIHLAGRHADVGVALSVPAAALAREVLRTMVLHKLRTAGLSVALLAIVATGTGWLIRPAAQADNLQLAPVATQAPASAKQGDSATRPARMTAVGRVLDPQGKPVPDAVVMILVRSKFSDRPLLSPTVHQGTCDRSGHFQIELPRTNSAQHVALLVTALAPGYGIGWAEMNADAERPAADINLRPEQIVRGRLFDLQGQPARGVALRVFSINPIEHQEVDVLTSIARPDFVERPGQAMVAWPGPAISDDQGRFTLRGLGPGLSCQVIAHESRYAIQPTVIETVAGADGPDRFGRRVIHVEPGAEAKPIAIVVQPARSIIGRVTYADTGRPVPRATVGQGERRTETDDDGRFRAVIPGTSPTASLLRVQAPDGSPYLIALKRVEWPSGAVEQTVDVALTRGVVIRGKVVEEGTGRPIAGAALQYMGRSQRQSERAELQDTVRTGPDGSCELVVRPEPGTLFVMGTTEDYVLQMIGEQMAREGRPGGFPWYAHAIIACDLKPGTDTRDISVVLRRGATVKARVIGPDSKPIPTAEVWSRLVLEPSHQPWRQFRGRFHGAVHDGHYQLHGLAPDAKVPVFFFDSNNKLGATATFSVEAAKDGLITVRLEPWGTATGRLVDPAGKPLARYPDPYLISMFVTPRSDGHNLAAANKADLEPERDYLLRIDPDRYANLVSDAEGRVTFPALIPGATYRINDMTTLTASGGRKFRAVFVARARETIDLGDILIEKPE